MQKIRGRLGGIGTILVIVLLWFREYIVDAIRDSVFGYSIGMVVNMISPISLENLEVFAPYLAAVPLGVVSLMAVAGVGYNINIVLRWPFFVNANFSKAPALTTAYMERPLQYDESAKSLTICRECRIVVNNRNFFRTSELSARELQFPGVLFTMNDTMETQPFNDMVSNLSELNNRVGPFMDRGMNMFMSEHLLSNNGEQTLYNLMLASNVTYQEDIDDENGNKKSGNILKRHEVNFHLIDRIEAGETISIWFMNVSNKHVSLGFSEIISAELEGSGRVAIPYLLHPKHGSFTNLLCLFPKTWT